MSIEDIVLSHDRRGLSVLRNHLPLDFCHDAAAFILDIGGPGRRRVIIATGFYVSSAGAPETDGPPGALAIGMALHALGFDVMYVTDRYTAPLLSGETMAQEDVIDFPITDHESSRRFAERISKEIRPSLMISVERCGLNRSQAYLNMAGDDITEHTAKIDYLFSARVASVGIGDGGNEIGMGNLAQYIPEVATLPQAPALTRVDKLVIASVSNWGAYGLIAALSRLTERNLLPSVERERDTIKGIVARGAVDGVSGRSIAAVDSFDLESNARALSQLQRLLDTRS